jgi:hypothetical protein
MKIGFNNNNQNPNQTHFPNFLANQKETKIFAIKGKIRANSQSIQFNILFNTYILLC